jgi:trans-2,3-dihydro-3-hydroxyanthranilate isomerase
MPGAILQATDESMTPTTLRYLHLDVFTANRFEGNQLAVFADPPDIPAALMQRIAAEMAFSESTFIFAPSGTGDVRMRIFTPGEELPMAGHPTIGSTFALAAEGRIQRGRDKFVFELGVGPIEVSLEWSSEGLGFAWMTQLLPKFGPPATNRLEIAAALGVDPTDLDGDRPFQSGSCGVPFFFVPLRTRRAVDAVAIDRRAFTRALTAAGIEPLPVFVFTNEKGGGDETVYSRMLAPGFGISEDPATGSASGPLGCYLLHHGMVTEAEARQMVSLQGVAMKRPSRVHISIDSEAGRITRVRVGGQSVVVGRGEIEI